MSVTLETEQKEVRSGRPSAAQVLETMGLLSAVGTLALGLLGTIPEHTEFEVGREVFGDIPTPIRHWFGIE